MKSPRRIRQEMFSVDKLINGSSRNPKDPIWRRAHLVYQVLVWVSGTPFAKTPSEIVEKILTAGDA